MSKRAQALADRLEQGAQELITFAEQMSDDEWKVVRPGDGRTVGVIAHHVASAYPVEMGLVGKLASVNNLRLCMHRSKEVFKPRVALWV